MRASQPYGTDEGLAPRSGFVQPLAQAERQRQATRPGLAVRGTFSPARAWRPAVVARLAQTLAIQPAPPGLRAEETCGLWGQVLQSNI